MPNRTHLLPYLFLFCALPVQLFLAVMVPTGEVPDEVAHIIRMDSLLHGDLIGHRTTRLDGAGETVADSGVTANAGLLAAGFTFIPGTLLAERVLTRTHVAELAARQWEKEASFVSVPNTAVYAPLFYVPGAIGMGAAKAMGAGPWESVLWARTVNAVTYAAIGFAALILARRIRGLLFATLLLPMSLWLAASCNQDGLIIATAALAAALLTRGTLPGFWTGAIALAAVALAKPPYLPLVGSLVVFLPWRGAAPLLRTACAITAALPALAWYALAQHTAVVPFVRGLPFTAGPYWPGDPAQLFTVADPAMQLRVLLHRPSLLITLPLKSMLQQSKILVWSTIGLLGVFDLLLPAGLYVAWIGGLAALFAGEGIVRRSEHPWYGPLSCVWILLCVATTILAVADAQYVSWTLTGAALIDGIQGRYFIPLLPFTALAIPPLRLASATGLRWTLRIPVIAAALAGLAIIPELVVSTYYLR